MKQVIEDAIELGEKVLKELNIDFKIVLTDGTEGFCHRESKEIHFGREATNNKKLMLHEIAHILTGGHHYTEEFNNKYKGLCDRFI